MTETKLLPKEPTPRMIRAGMIARQKIKTHGLKVEAAEAREIYKAMYEAAVNVDRGKS